MSEKETIPKFQKKQWNLLLRIEGSKFEINKSTLSDWSQSAESDSGNENFDAESGLSSYATRQILSEREEIELEPY